MIYFFLLVLHATVVVGLEATFYTVGESDAVVEICISATGANSSCPSSVPFQVLLSAFSPSAGMWLHPYHSYYCFCSPEPQQPTLHILMGHTCS